MKKTFVKQLSRFCLTILSVFVFQIWVIAQNTKVEINGNDVGSWFSRNWVWVTLGIVILVIFLLISGGSRSSRHRTTIFRNNKGEVTKTEITKTDEV
jgi:hypothetical protein